MLQSLYERTGPFASVYLDTGRAVPQGEQRLELRSKAMAERLEGADQATLDALEAVFTDVNLAAPGRAAFACGGEVLYTEALPDKPRRETARWSPLPHVMPLLAQRGENVPHVQVIIDHTGADVIVVGEGSPRRTTIQEEDWPLQKTAQGGWSQRRYENSVEEAWARNARAVAEAVDEEVRRMHAELVIVAGDPQSRPLLQQNLGQEALDRLVVVDKGSRAAGTDLFPFHKEVEAAIDGWLDRRQDALMERYGEALSKGLAAEGLPAVTKAFREGRVDTLLMVDHSDADGMVWIGPEGGQLATDREELREWGVSEPVEERADAALARAVAMTNAHLVFVPRLEAPDEVAALLRF
ncbi:baeRF2 domain-containing protein [Planobispora rosea]|nr:Vms1/Ankzf1 family peptidyl-tRNA hydrolase [Planobispora rosea]